MKIADFVGLAKPKLLLQKLAVSPNCRALLFEGKSGSGKTAMALAFAAEIPAEVHLLPANECTRENLSGLWVRCQGYPLPGFRKHLVLVDQADTLRMPQQLDLRSYIDGPSALDHVLWVFTGVPSDRLEDGFRSRCLQLEFSTYGNSKAAAELLERVWQAEVPNAPPPNFARLIKEANGNILAALQQMELKLMAV